MDILLVDDDALCREALAEFIGEQLGHTVMECPDGKNALGLFEKQGYPVVISDIRMPGMNGIELLRKIRSFPHGQDTSFIFLTGYGDLCSAVEALRSGAFDYLLKPVNIEELAEVLSRVGAKGPDAGARTALDFSELHGARETPIRERLRAGSPYCREVEEIGAIGLFSKHARETAAMAELFHSDRTIPVLIEGETGTGKEIIARIVHHGPENVMLPFISLNCSAISSMLFESELFGYEPGAFTGAKKSGMPGKMEIAAGGTLYLDEIGDLPLDMQPKLLRALEEKAIFRVGGTKKIPLDVRIICSTNLKLRDLVEAGKFRSDLYFRLNTGRIELKPLRETPEAVVPLAQMFLDSFAIQKKRGFKIIQKESAEMLESHSWPGNIRELKNAIERSVFLYDDVELRPHHLKHVVRAPSNADESPGTMLNPEHIHLPPDKLDITEFENEVLRRTLEKFKGNKTQTASYLGISRSALRSRLRRLHSGGRS